MAMAVIEISIMVEISFCEALMRMSFAGYEPITIAAIEVISVRAFSEVLSPRPTVMCHCTGVHVPASAHASGVSHRRHASGMSHRSGVHCACATHASSMSHRNRRRHPCGHRRRHHHLHLHHPPPRLRRHDQRE